jgi:putative heme-binding domain-containing protein
MVRGAALDGLAYFADKPSVEFLKSQAGGGKSRELRARAVSALATIDAAGAAALAVEVLAMEGEFDHGSIFTAFLSRQGGPDALAKALAGKKLKPDTARVGIRIAETRRQPGGEKGPETRLIESLRLAGALGDETLRFTPAEMEKLATEVVKQGDPEKGEEIYRRSALSCQKCHAIGGAGGLVGPDLSSIGTTAQLDYLIDSIFDPNKAIKENYHSTSVVTRDGRVLTGIKLRETPAELVLRDPEGREIPIRRSNIARAAMGGSLMPSGLTGSLTRTELRDLVRFLSEIGKIGKYSVGKKSTARRWRVLEKAPVGFGQGNSNVLPGPGDSGLSWSPAYSTVSGVLPLSALSGGKKKGAGYAWSQLRVVTSGDLRLSLNSNEGLQLWVAGKEISLEKGKAGSGLLSLPVGVHPVLFKVELDKRRGGIRCGVDDVPGSRARAQFVVGN